MTDRTQTSSTSLVTAGTPIPELKEELTRVAERALAGENTPGWGLLAVSFNDDVYYDGYPEGTDVTREERVYLRMQSTGNVRGQKVSFAATRYKGIVSVGRISVGDEVAY